MSGKYEIVAGHRRWAAAKTAGLTMIPAIVLDVDKKTEQVIRVSENLHRWPLSVYEEAMAIEALLKMHRTTEEAAADLAMSATTVARRARLLALIPKWRKRIDDEPASALELVARYDVRRQEALYDRFGDYLPETDRLKVILAEADHRVSTAPWKQDDEGLYPKAGACKTCEKRSDCQALLFHDDQAKAPKEARCLDPTCWHVKLQAHITAAQAALKQLHDVVVKVQTQYTGTEIDGALRPYQFERCKKTDKGAVPAVILDGPSAGQTTYVKVKRKDKASSRAKSKLDDMSAADQLKARDLRLLGRRSMHMVKALREILDKKEPAMRKWAQGDRRILMLDLSIEFGLRSEEYIGPRTWTNLVERREKPADETFDDWWKLAKNSLSKPLSYIQKTEQAALLLPELEFFATGIMGEDWDALRRDAVAAIPDRRLKAGDEDPFNPGDRASKTAKASQTKLKPIEPILKPKDKKRKRKPKPKK